MSPRARYLATTLVLVAAVAAYALWQRPLDRPTPRLPVASAPPARPAPPPVPPTARRILDRAAVLGLTHEQVVRLRALDRFWTNEERELQAAVRDAEQELSGFMKEAQGSRGASVQQIQQRSAEYSSLSATLRERRRRHSEAALQLLDGRQRHRLAGAGPGTEVGRDR
ncbi:MAG TPA: hypothetical protein VK878_21365 [Candidatus Deferrimicrobiaceae bacterium]|nr:hypothetical protein [Candidatus Deferrimicrobiaceae bacterium]